ncbi:MAG: aldo/keto reductase [Amycolatopsis sp.]|uniref:hypothetical protein n=1 Tax=Amycolatopsis sp. TaxID=37632 RepID=UPI00262E33A8|nr:hypothetical protein [Amycolatopsis sp.]MCU1686186.1 aldo/keto reductase [Amycolatopsis sp.]
MPERTTVTIGGDLPAGRIGYGAMRLTGADLWGEHPDRESGIALLREAVRAAARSGKRDVVVLRDRLGSSALREKLPEVAVTGVVSARGRGRSRWSSALGTRRECPLRA